MAIFEGLAIEWSPLGDASVDYLLSKARAVVDRTSRNSIWKSVFSDDKLLECYLRNPSLQVSDTLLQIIKADKPPTLQELKQLPQSQDHRSWGKYLLILEKIDRKAKVYVGSATKIGSSVSRRQGFEARFYQYNNPKLRSSKIPAGIKLALKDGYEITAKKILCTMQMPEFKLRKSYRAFLVILETIFSAVFWALRSRVGYDPYLMNTVRHWPLKSFTWDGLCSHVATNLPVRGPQRPEPHTEAFRGQKNAKERLRNRERHMVMKKAEWDRHREKPRARSREYQRRKRATEKSKEREARLAKSRERYHTPGEAREQTLAYHRNFQRKKRAQEPPEERQRRLEKERAKKANQSPEDREAKLLKSRQGYKRRREAESPEKYEARREEERRKKRLRTEMSEEELERVRAADRARSLAKRLLANKTERKTPVSKEDRNAKRREARARRIAKRTPQEAAEWRVKDREAVRSSVQKRKANATAEELEELRAQRRRYRLKEKAKREESFTQDQLQEWVAKRRKAQRKHKAKKKAEKISAKEKEQSSQQEDRMNQRDVESSEAAHIDGQPGKKRGGVTRHRE